MDEDRQNPPRIPNDKKPSQAGGGTLWLVVGVVLIILFVASLIRNPHRVDLPLTELRRLIAQGVPDPKGNPDPSITIVENRGKEKQRTVKYSNLAVDRVGPERITGTVTCQVVAPPEQAGEATAEVPFISDCWGVGDGNADLMDLLYEKGFKDVRGESFSTFWRNWGPLALFLLIMLPFFLIMMRRISGAGGAMAFGRSRGKLFAQEDIEESFNDVAGIDEAVEELREVVEFLKNPEKYRVLGGRIPKGVLLVGPPGTGKTLLARAIAGEAGVPFFSLSGSDFVEMFVGVGAARVRDLFQQAESKAPCIVFIDELDALGKTRGSSIVGGHDEREQTLNALLVEMDGFSSNSGTIVMAATNRPETLDPALLRSGRFDRQVLVDRPDVRGRESILKVHVKNVKLNEDVDLKRVAAITSGFVGADLANLVNEAALLAARNSKESVTMVEFNEAVERVTTGLEKRQRLIQEDEKQRVAYHESAHALVAYSLPNTDPVHKVSIIPRGLAALGYTVQRPEGDRYLMTQSELESRIQVLLAGTIAEEIVFDDVSTGAQNDLERATEIARRMVMEFGMSRLGRVAYRETPGNIFLGGGAEMPRDRYYSERTAREIDEEIRRIIDESLEHVRRILENRKEALVALATRLIEKEVIDYDELKGIVEEASPSPKIVPGTEGTVKRTPSAKVADCEAGDEPREAGESHG
jgi:cell division protease FtsH